MSETNARQEAIVQSAERMMEEFELWAGDVAIDFDSPLADAIEICVAKCGRGDVPEQCRELVTAVGRVEIEWEKYCGAHFVPGSRLPLDSFLKPFNDVALALQGCRPAAEAVVPNVAEELALGTDKRTLAKMFGVRDDDGTWRGPFWTNGVLRTDLIDQEAKTPGAVLGKDWKHPETERKRKEQDERNRCRLERLDKASSVRDSRQSRREYIPTDEEIIAYASEGAFLSQFPKQWPTCSMERASKVLEEAGVIPASKEDPRKPAQRAADERRAAEELKESLVGKPANDPDADKELNARILEMNNSGSTPAEIRLTLSQEFNTTISPQKVGAVIRDAETK